MKVKQNQCLNTVSFKNGVLIEKVHDVDNNITYNPMQYIYLGWILVKKEKQLDKAILGQLEMFERGFGIRWHYRSILIFWDVIFIL